MIVMPAEAAPVKRLACHSLRLAFLAGDAMLAPSSHAFRP